MSYPDRAPRLSRRPLLLALAGIPLALGGRDAESAAPEYREHQDLSYYLNQQGERRPVRTPDDWQVRRAHILAGMQAVMGPLPGADHRVPLEVRTEEEVKVGDLVRRKVTYATAPGNRIAAYLFLPAKRERPAPAALCLHPTGELGKGIVSGLGGKPNRQYALELAERGYVTLAPDYPSFGEYACDFSTGGWASGTMRAVWDNIRSVDLLRTVAEADAKRIGAIGHSLGGHNAIFTALFEPRLRAVVSSCGFTRFHKYYGGKLTGWTSPRYMPRIATVYGGDPDRVPFDFPELIAALAPRPFFTNSPLHDANFEVSGVRDCIAAAAPVYALHGAADRLQARYPDCDHDFPNPTREEAYRFLDRHLSAG